MALWNSVAVGLYMYILGFDITVCIWQEKHAGELPKYE